MLDAKKEFWLCFMANAAPGTVAEFTDVAEEVVLPRPLPTFVVGNVEFTIKSATISNSACFSKGTCVSLDAYRAAERAAAERTKNARRELERSRKKRTRSA
jgi:hypothetical protein